MFKLRKLFVPRKKNPISQIHIEVWLANLNSSVSPSLTLNNHTNKTNKFIKWTKTNYTNSPTNANRTQHSPVYVVHWGGHVARPPPVSWRRRSRAWGPRRPWRSRRRPAPRPLDPATPRHCGSGRTAVEEEGWGQAVFRNRLIFGFKGNRQWNPVVCVRKKK